MYALGLTLYELLAFRPAFVETDRSRLMRQILTGAPGRLEQFNAEIPRDLATIVHKAIDRDPRCRYQTAREFADDLQRFLADEPIRARRPWLAERLVRWSRRNKGLAAALATIATLLITGTVASGLAAEYFRRLAGEAADGRHKAEQAIDRERWQRYRFQHCCGRERPATPEHWPGPHLTGRGAERIPQLGMAAPAQPTRRCAVDRSSSTHIHAVGNSAVRREPGRERSRGDVRQRSSGPRMGHDDRLGARSLEWTRGAAERVCV